MKCVVALPIFLRYFFSAFIDDDVRHFRRNNRLMDFPHFFGSLWHSCEASKCINLMSKCSTVWSKRNKGTVLTYRYWILDNRLSLVTLSATNLSIENCSMKLFSMFWTFLMILTMIVSLLWLFLSMTMTLRMLILLTLLWLDDVVVQHGVAFVVVDVVNLSMRHTIYETFLYCVGFFFSHTLLSFVPIKKFFFCFSLFSQLIKLWKNIFPQFYIQTMFPV